VVVEVASDEDVSSFAAFQNDLRRRVPDTTRFTGTAAVAFVTMARDTLQFTFGGARVLNGRPVSVAGYPLFDGPWIQSVAGSGVIRLTDGSRERILDFRNITIEER
jgi:hypothetical protein